MEDVINYLRKVRRGTMFIIEGPSGTGKGTVIKEILARDPHIKFSVSVTTRPPRKGEVNGVDYYFISDEEYDRLKTEDAFYEYVDSQYGSRYGTLRSEVDSFINVGEDVLFDLDWMGARQMKEKAGADAVTIYLLPPSIREVRRRLEGRGTDSREVIEKRMDLVLEKSVTGTNLTMWWSMKNWKTRWKNPPHHFRRKNEARPSVKRPQNRGGRAGQRSRRNEGGINFACKISGI